MNITCKVSKRHKRSVLVLFNLLIIITILLAVSYIYNGQSIFLFLSILCAESAVFIFSFIPEFSKTFVVDSNKISVYNRKGKNIKEYKISETREVAVGGYLGELFIVFDFKKKVVFLPMKDSSPKDFNFIRNLVKSKNLNVKDKKNILN